MENKIYKDIQENPKKDYFLRSADKQILAWKAGEYDCGGSIVFPKQYDKELKVISEERKE